MIGLLLQYLLIAVPRWFDAAATQVQIGQHGQGIGMLRIDLQQLLQLRARLRRQAGLLVGAGELKTGALIVWLLRQDPLQAFDGKLWRMQMSMHLGQVDQCVRVIRLSLQQLLQPVTCLPVLATLSQSGTGDGHGR